MKYVAYASSCIISFLFSQPLWAHGDAEGLGHHWESQAYISEMRVQFALMVALAITIVVGNAVARTRRKRSASR